MFGYSLEQWLLFFYLYCFFGWCFESTYVSIKSKHFVNRGFMRGPFLPLYGSGAIMMLVVSNPFKDNLLLTYIAGCVGATILELITGAAMEHLFKFRYWDYSYKKIQYKGYICLSSSLFWGVLTIIMNDFIHPPIEKWVLSWPVKVSTTVFFVVTVYMAADFALSFKEALDLRDILIKLEEARQDMAKIQERLAATMENASDQVKTAITKKMESAGEQVKTTMSQKAAQAGALRDELRNRTGQLKPEFVEGWEERIKNLQESVDESTSEKMTGIRTEYREWKEKMEENTKKVENITKFANIGRIHHLYRDPYMVSKKFAVPLNKLKEEVKKRRQ